MKVEPNTITVLKNSLIVYKATYFYNDNSKKYFITTLKLPKGTKVRWGGKETLYGVNKHRANQAIVVQNYNIKTRGKQKTTYSEYAMFFKYTVGEKVFPSYFDDNVLATCTGGIHFFLTRKEARFWCEL